LALIADRRASSPAGVVGTPLASDEQTWRRTLRWAFVFEPIDVNANAPGGARVLRTFADVGAFILIAVDLPRRLSPHWSAVRRDLVQARFGARRAEAHQAIRDALAAEGWLAD
jgi:hypothetical protein